MLPQPVATAVTISPNAAVLRLDFIKGAQWSGALAEFQDHVIDGLKSSTNCRRW